MERNIALITGIGGGLAQLAAKELAGRGFEVVGVDYRSEVELSFVEVSYRANYNKTKIEDIIRRHRPNLVLHLGRVGNLKEQAGKRFDLNVVGSQKVMDLAARYGAKRIVVLSTFHIYGAHPHNHIPICEHEPLRAGADFPQIADAIQLDNQAVLWAYRHPECRTALLRPTHVVGPDISNAISTFLRADTLPVMAGFDPMVQFVHQDDLVRAIVAVTLGQSVGVFNVAGKGVVPLRKALAAAGGRIVPVPSVVATGYLKFAGLFRRTLPSYLVNFLKYPCVISTQLLRETFGWEPRVDQLEAVRSTVQGEPSVSAAPGAR